MPFNVIVFTLEYPPEGGLIEHFLTSSVVRDFCESDPYPWLVTAVNREQFMELIDEYTGENQLNEDQRATLVGWYVNLEDTSGAGRFIAIVDRFGGYDSDE